MARFLLPFLSNLSECFHLNRLTAPSIVRGDAHAVAAISAAPAAGVVLRGVVEERMTVRAGALLDESGFSAAEEIGR